VSGYAIILEVSEFLRKTLWSGFEGDATLTQHITQLGDIVLLNPADVIKNKNDRRLSLWLYQVQENPFMRNQTPTRIPQQDDTVQFPPLALNLYYLLTPSTNSVEGDQLVLGRSMQIFYDNSILLLQGKEQSSSVEELHINMCQRDLRELAEVWEALQQPYRLSVCYEVRVTRIDSQRTLRTGRVAERTTQFEENPVEVE
jgi:uncharacterized protein DUF4255